MAASKMPKLNLPTVDDLFRVGDEHNRDKREWVRDIPIDKICDFPSHPFKVRDDGDMKKLTESVREHGVLVPALVREKSPDSYEMISGHRRKMASRLAGEMKMPCIIKDLTDSEAILLLVDSNLQREHLLPSEKAYAYKMKLDALKKQGNRTDLTSRPLGEKLSVDVLSENVKDSARQIHRYIRLTELIKPLLDLADRGKISIRSAVELSYLPKEHQTELNDVMVQNNLPLKTEHAQRIRALYKEKKINKDKIREVLSANRDIKQNSYFKNTRIAKYFPPGTSEKQMEEIIIKALKKYQDIT